MRWVALVFALATQAHAQTTDPEAAQELAALEAALAADAQVTPAPAPMPPATPLNPNLALILDVAAAAYDQEKPLQTGAHDAAQSGLTMQNLELNMNSAVDQVFRLDANIVFSEFGVEVEEAYATTIGLPHGLQARAGQFLSAFGRINRHHPHTWDFADQPLVIGKFMGGEGNRGVGVEGSVLAPLPWHVILLGALSRTGGEATARSYQGADALPVKGLDDLLSTARLEQFFDFGPDLGLLWGVSFQTGKNATGPGNRSALYGTDLNLRYRPRGSTEGRALTFQAEGIYRRRQVPDTVLVDDGLYAQLVYQHTRQWAAGLRTERVSGAEDDPLDPTWDSVRSRHSAQITYLPSHFSRLRLQGNAARQTPSASLDWGAILALEVLIGAHPAHAY